MSRIVSRTIFAFVAALPCLLLQPAAALAEGAQTENNGAISTTDGTSTPAESQFRLLMVEQTGCIYCRMWNNDLAPIYPKTPEGKLAPLERVDLHKPFPEDVTITKGRPVFTPTFILLRDGVEIGRLEGYTREDFFWGLLGKALRDGGADLPDPNG
ncbi:hypothetical protein [Thioclava atlantica]|uniref:SoxS protein n=1 Tax=Thioclava atlantica TaxID=1317124 RepID=A0A085U1Y0_9RHOB|nr:hypothetical protein [Thioclava atlantica]KFE36977.1 SoxS protein [Thioclava atlantica]